MAYSPKTVKETKVEPLTQQTHDKSEEEIRQPADKIRPDEGKRAFADGRPKGTRKKFPLNRPQWGFFSNMRCPSFIISCKTSAKIPDVSTLRPKWWNWCAGHPKTLLIKAQIPAVYE
ncbi:hypothetical protein SFC43_13120 [Bacteroides sp. CR5/BHMF/2]|nr:hypothetical protein [Bacteroides sp. CR5/BHMF/2]